jgi:hypothetical protein
MSVTQARLVTKKNASKRDQSPRRDCPDKTSCLDETSQPGKIRHRAGDWSLFGDCSCVETNHPGGDQSHTRRLLCYTRWTHRETSYSSEDQSHTGIAQVRDHSLKWDSSRPGGDCPSRFRMSSHYSTFL